MSHGFAINSEHLRESGTQIQQLGGRLGGRQSGMNAQVAGSPAVWGADEEGAAFGTAYQEVTARLAELLGAMAEAFDVVGGNLITTADNFDAADAGVTERLAALGERLGREK